MIWKVAPYSTQIVQIVHIQLLRIQLLRLFRCYTDRYTGALQLSSPNQPACVPACTLVYLASIVYILQQTILSTHRTLNTSEGITIYTTNMDYLLCCEIWRRSVFLSVFNYMLNTRVSQWCKQIKSRKTLVCLLVQNYY